MLVNGTPISRKSLEDVRLVITSTDLDSVVSTKEVPDFKLFADRETVYEFQVPQRLANIRFTLKAKIQNYSHNQKVDLAAEQAFSINEIDRTDKTEDLHFAPRRRRLHHRSAWARRAKPSRIGRCKSR